MRKYLLAILVGFLSFMGLAIGANAASAPSTFNTGDVIKLTEYVPGIGSYYKPIAGGLEVFCEDAGLTYVTGITYKLKGKIDDGYIYIFENRPNTGDKNKDYYIQSIAVWWYKDYLTGKNTNLTQAQKDYITSHRNSNTVCKLIYNLVEGAKKYKQEKGTISFSSGTVTFTEADGYYVSNKITVKGTNLTSGKIELVNAPSGSKLINSTVSKTGNGTFQIQVPKSSIAAGKTVTFSIKGTGTYGIKKMYDYYLEKDPSFANPFQQVIYGKVYTDTYEVKTTKSISITRDVNKLSITKVDDSGKALSGAGLTLYKGDCTNSTCSSANKYATWTSTTSAKSFTDIPVGKYTLVETKTPEGYKTASKMLINIDSTSKTYTYKMTDVKEHNKLSITKYDKETNKALAGAGLTLYKGNCKNTTCTSANKYATWTSTTSAKVFNDLPLGDYTLVETKTPDGYLTANKEVVHITTYSGTYTIKMYDAKAHNKLSITKVDESGKALSGAGLTLYKGDCTSSTCTSSNQYATWTSTTSAKSFTDIPVGKYTLVETKTPEGFKTASKMLINIDSNNKTYTYKMIDQKELSIRISKTDITGQNEVPGATLVLKDANGKVVEKWVSKSTPHFMVLDEGIYTLTETIAPKGYILNESVITFKLDANNNVYEKNANGQWVQVDYIKMINEKELKVRISKTDITGDKEVPGATLVLKDANGKVVEKWVSTTTPHYSILDAGEYSLTETIAPKGYILNESTINFKLDANNNVYEKNESGNWVQVDYIKMINERELSVRISKTDITGEPEIPGASLVLKDANDNVVASWISTTEPHYEVLKAGVYKLTETIAPKGYVLSKSAIEFKLDDDGNVFQKNANGAWTKVDYIKMVNLSKEAINISKLDSETNEYVSGATLQIKNNKGEVIATWTTTNESHYVSLEEGEYVLSETKAPKGYVLNAKLTYFKVDADGIVYIIDSKGEYVQSNGVIMYNEPEKIEIPATGLTSTLTYVLGTAVLGFGAIMLYRNEKQC